MITSIIVDRLEKKTFSFRSFYESRLRRIYPALFVLVVVVFFLCQIIYLDNFTALRRSAQSSLLWYSNFYFYDKTGYFDVPAVSQVLLHTWSLSVEAQFYFIYPILFVFCYNRWKAKISLCLVGLALLSFVSSLYSIHADPKAAFTCSPPERGSCCWEAFWQQAVSLLQARQVNRRLFWPGLF